MKTLRKLSYGLGAAIMASPIAALAVPEKIDPLGGGAGNITIAQLLTKVITWVLSFAAAIAVLFLIFGGLQYVTSAGNKDRIEKAKQTILYAVIGLIVIALSFVIVTFINTNLKAAL